MPQPIHVDLSQQTAYQRIWDELCKAHRTGGAGIPARPPQWVKATRGKKKCLVCGKVIAVGEDYVSIVEWNGKLLESFCSETCLEQLLNAGSIPALRTAQASAKAVAEREAQEAKKVAKAAAKAAKPPVEGHCATCGKKTKFADGRQYQCDVCRSRELELGGISEPRFCRKCGNRFTVEMVQQRICPKCRS